MPKARAGVLIECDPSIKAIIMKIDREQQHRIVMEEIDDEHVLIQNDKHDELKELLKNVSRFTRVVLLIQPFSPAQSYT
ncbi:hypothetical protein D0864_02936 [Hortaea werneckii]|uniref:General transcription and DNA repair factor IIH subunit TFB5 n=2 Tax=Hortaea werneckii TaxID=91943 RepID=A0A3M7GRE0_HORWE|nr:hypothetical protein D0864_02936 [Hortaea werneckii]